MVRCSAVAALLPAAFLCTSVAMAQPADMLPPRVTAVAPAPDRQIVDNVGLRTISLTLNEAVTLPLGSTKVWSDKTQRFLDHQAAFDQPTRRLIITLSLPVFEDRLTAVADYAITDLAGNALDGEIAAPSAPTLPSGDGRPGEQAVFQFTVLQGDVNRSGVVDQADANLIVAAIGAATGQPRFNPLADLNSDGVVNVLDVAIWHNGLGGRLPPLDAGSPIIVQLSPNPALPLADDLFTIDATFSEPVDARRLDVRSLFILGLTGQPVVPAAVLPAPDGRSARFVLMNALPRCATYAAVLTNAIADPSGRLLGAATPFLLDGLRAAVPPTANPLPTTTQAATAQVTGQAPSAAVIEVVGPGGVATGPVTAGAYSVQAPLGLNRVNRLVVTSISGCGVRSAPVTVDTIQDRQPPNLFIDFPAANAAIQAASTDVAGRVGDMLSGFMGLTVTVNGQAAAVDDGIGNNGTFSLMNITLNTSGPTTLTVIARDIAGNERVREIQVQRVAIPPDAAVMSTVSGNGQTARIHTWLPQPIVVRLVNSTGQPLIGKTVTFDVTRSDGLLAANTFGGGSMMFQATTDFQGVARAFWRIGADAGCGNNRVEVISRDLAGTVAFCASATPGPLKQINIGSGNNQRGEVNAPAFEPLRAWVSDSCNGVEGVPVTFRVTSGGGLVNGQSQVTVPTGRTGHAEVNYTFDPDAGNQTVEAQYVGNPTGPATFVAYGLVRDLAMPTSFSGLVLDNAMRPIGGVGIRLTVNGVDLGQVLTTLQGQFEFPSVPAGLGHIDIDGLIANFVDGQPIMPPAFPTLENEIVLVPNVANELVMPILMPPLDSCNKKDYVAWPDRTQPEPPPTILTISARDASGNCVPAIEGLRMIVRAGSMFINGQPAQTGAHVALNQVHHDDVPMPFPDGVAPPFAWTLKPAGATFDPPIEIEYPNMTGLPPGSIAYFLSFNHDSGRFEIVCSGSVTEDGSTIKSDPGAGLSIAGWGCNCPPYSVTGKCRPCEPTANGCGAEGGQGFPEAVPCLTLTGYRSASFRMGCDGHDRCWGSCGANRRPCDL